MNAFGMRLLLGEIVPFAEIVGLKGAIVVVEDDLGAAFEEQRECASGGADIDCLPEPIQHQNLLIQV